MLQLVFEVDGPVRIILDHEAAPEVLRDDTGSRRGESGHSSTWEHDLLMGKIDVRAPASDDVIESLFLPLIFLHSVSARARQNPTSGPTYIGDSLWWHRFVRDLHPSHSFDNIEMEARE